MNFIITKRWFYFTLLSIMLALWSSNVYAVGEASTRFNVYVPPNNNNVGRDVCLLVTAIMDSTTINIIDDDADGDSDDSYSGMLNRGQTYILYIRDNAVNDEAPGKWDGDYFRITADHPVLVSQSTDSDWQHDYVPAENQTMFGNAFYIYSPSTSYSARDINVFVYEDETTVTITDITVIPRINTGETLVDFQSGIEVANVTLDVGEDIIYKNTDGRNLLQPGCTYYVQSTKPIVVQYGALYRNERDGGGYVPSKNGYSSGELFYFTVPRTRNGEQEIRIVSFDDKNQVSLDYLSSGGVWTDLDDWTLNSFEHGDWVAPSNVSYDMFRITCTAGKKVSVFESSWLETGAKGTSDIISFVSSEAGTGAGTKFLTYMGPPGWENRCVNPFTSENYDGRYTHLFISGNNNNTTITIKDADSLGAIINRKYNIDAAEFIDVALDLDEYYSIYNGDGEPESGPQRPYLLVESDEPVSVMDANWNDNWMTYCSSVLPPSVYVTQQADTVDAAEGDVITFTSTVANNGTATITTGETNVIIDDGLNVTKSEFTLVPPGETLPPQTSVTSDGKEVLTVEDYDLDPGDALSITVAIEVDDILSNGANIPNGTVLSVTTTSSGNSGSEYVEAQSTDGVQISSIYGATSFENIIFAFEDLKQGEYYNDFDYNDIVCNANIKELYNLNNDLMRLEMTMEALARGAGYDHKVYLDLGIKGSADISVYHYDSTGVLIDSVIMSSDADYIQQIPIFWSSWQALPPINTGAYYYTSNTAAEQTASEKIKGFTTKINVQVNEPDQNPRIYDSPSTFSLDEHLYKLYGFWIHVMNTEQDIYQMWLKKGATQDIVSAVYHPHSPLIGYPLDQGLIVPSSWKWPTERTAIWDAYDPYDNYIVSGGSNYYDWYLFPDLAKVWPISQKVSAMYKQTHKQGTASWSFEANSVISASPAVGDLNGDGSLEIVVGSYLNKIFVINSEGVELATMDVNPAGIVESQSSPTIVDLDGDGDLEILRGYDDGKLYIYHHDGSLFLPADKTLTTAGKIKSTAAVGDLDGDGTLEIVVLSGDAKIYAFNTDGSTVAGFPQSTNGVLDQGGHFFIISSPALADIDNDNKLEIIVGSTLNEVYAFNHDGTILPNWPVNVGSAVLSSPAIANIDKDSYQDVVIGTIDGEIYVLNYQGNILAGWPQRRDIGGLSSPAIGDLDRDGNLEIIVGGQDAQLHIYNSDGSLYKDWPQYTGGMINSSPALANLDEDDQMEICIASYDANIYTFKMDGTNTMNFPVNATSIIFSSPAIADVNADGYLDIIVGSHDRKLYIEPTTYKCDTNEVVWAMFRKDARHTGLQLLCPSSIGKQQPAGIPTKYALHENYPNPFNATTLIKYDLLKDSKVTLKIVNLLGQEVKTLISSYKTAGYHHVIWDGTNNAGTLVASGAYFYHFKAGDFKAVKKMVLLK